MSSLGIGIGLKSLLAAQAGLETIGHNLSNANTPGYSRQSLQVSSSTPLRLRGLLQGTGLQTDAISRTVDALLHGRITSQVSALERIGARLETVSSVESFLGGTGENGMPALFKKMFQSFAELSTGPADPILRTSAVQSAAGVATSLNQLAANGAELGRDVFQRMRAEVAQVNELAGRISQLNQQIVDAEFGSTSANDLRDQRDQQIKELAQYVDVRAIEDPRGGLRVLVGGRMLVSPTTSATLELNGDPLSGDVALELGGEPLEVAGGRLGGLMALQSSFLPQLAGRIDDFARNLALEANRVHSTGVPRSGSFSALVSANALVDGDQDGDVADELLATAGLPFELTSGALYVNVVDKASGELSKHRIDIDASRTTAGAFAAALNAIPQLSSSIDSQGRLQIVAAPGYGFDFSARLDTTPDALGSFGGARASLATGASEPFALSPGDTLDFVGAGGPFTVTLGGAGFAQMGAATASELAAALNADAGFQSGGLRASAIDGAVVVQSAGSGASQSFQITGGSALGALGWSANTTVSGSDHDVAPRVSGAYTGATDDRWTFRPNMDGTIGSTPGLRIAVFDKSGKQLADLDVGPGYSPGDELDVLSGVQVAFGFGDVSASAGDVFQLDVVADSDTSDVLVALGLNALFVGSDAQSIAVRADLERDPGLLSASLSGASGDGGNVLRLLELENLSLGALGDQSLDEYLADIVSGVALEIDASQGAQEAERFLLDGLEARRDQISGVNTDEELVRMIEQEQSYNAAAQYLRVISELTAELMSII